MYLYINMFRQQTRVMYTSFGMQLNGEPYNIRRLSTPSMVQHKHPLATEWIWYDNGAQWFTPRSGISMVSAIFLVIYYWSYFWLIPFIFIEHQFC